MVAVNHMYCFLVSFIIHSACILLITSDTTASLPIPTPSTTPTSFTIATAKLSTSG